MSIEDKQDEVMNKFFEVKEQFSEDQVRKLEDSLDFFSDIYEEADIEILFNLLDEIDYLMDLYLLEKVFS